jgi:hypothetical protein
MTKFLITPTLINSYQYYIQDEFKSPADSRADFLKTLSRERFEPNEAMQKGIDFENDIYETCNNNCIANFNKIEPRFVQLVLENGVALTKDMKERTVMHQYINCVVDFANIVKGGLWQQTCKKDLQVGDKEFLLYGKMDVIKRDTIYDIKFTGNYEIGKFLDSAQHLIYLYCSGLPTFQYLISDGKDYWIEDYHNHIDIENEIKSKISDFLGYLENDKEAKEMFETKWGSK